MDYKGPDRRNGRDRRRRATLDWMEVWAMIGMVGRWGAITLAATFCVLLFMLFYSLMFAFFGGN